MKVLLNLDIIRKVLHRESKRKEGSSFIERHQNDQFVDLVGITYELEPVIKIVEE